MPALVKSFPVIGEVTVHVDDTTAKRLTDDEGWKLKSEPKPRTRAKADKK